MQWEKSSKDPDSNKMQGPTPEVILWPQFRPAFTLTIPLPPHAHTHVCAHRYTYVNTHAHIHAHSLTHRHVRAHTDIHKEREQEHTSSHYFLLKIPWPHTCTENKADVEAGSSLPEIP